MIDIKKKEDCTGCNACYDACPKDAISLTTDIEGFWYPVVDKSRCIDCGICDRTCPVINIEKLKKNEFVKPVCYAAIHKNIEVRFGSTSGGIFSALAEQMYAEGGYVGGAIYDEDFTVRHYISNSPDDLLRLRQSKYSQSHTEGIFEEVKRLLSAGEKVLICGTPCQMAGLRAYLKKDYENLIIVDFICKSITSPKFYSKYLDYWERKEGSKLISFKFKDKELGWRHLVKRFDFQNGKSVYVRSTDRDLYSTAYHGNIASRPSCYDCKFKGMPRLADITIADFWGIDHYDDLKVLDDDAGTSEILINNSKGQAFFDKIKKRITVLPAKLEQMVPYNYGIYHSQLVPSIDRKTFWEDIDNLPIEEVVPKYLQWHGEQGSKIKRDIKRFLRPLYNCLRYSRLRPSLIFRFIQLNFFSKNVKTHWMENGVIYPLPYSIIELQKNTQVILHGPLIVGTKRIKKSHLETRLLLQRGSRLIVNKHFHIGYGGSVELFYDSVMEIDECGSNIGLTIVCGKSITMHGHVSIGRDVSIRDTNGHIIAQDGFKMDRPVVIENHVWLCSGCTISPGVKIREGAVVGASSYVVQNVPAHTLVSGHPAKVALRNIAWKL